MSSISENRNKLPLDIISNLLKKLLDSKLSKLEIKNKDEMNKIKSLSQNTEVIINELQNINKKIKPKTKLKKSIKNIYQPLNQISSRKNNIRLTQKLNTTSISFRTNERTPDRKCYSKMKNLKNNNIRKLNRNKSEIFNNDLFMSKSNTSKILNMSKMGSGTIKKSRSKKKHRDLTPRPTTPSNILRKKRKEKTKQCLGNNNTNDLSMTRHNTSTSLLTKNYNKSCKILPYMKKNKLNFTKISKNDELELICQNSEVVDKRIYDLNPDISKKILNKNKNKDKNKKITSLLFNRTITEDSNKHEDTKELLTLDDSMMNDVNNDELLIFYHNKKTMRLIDDITLTKSFLDENCDCELDLEIHSESQHLIFNKNNNNYTMAERLENSIDYFAKYLTKEELLKLGLMNKECFKMIMHYLISKTEDAIDDIKEALTLLKNNNPDIIDKKDENNNFNIKPFECNIHSSRAISLLNSVAIDNLFHTDDLNNKYIILVFDLFFIALGYKKQILSFRNDKKSKWNFYKLYFEKNCNKFFGNSIENKIKGKIFDNNIINTLYEFSHDYINIITPSYFQKINNDVALFVFIVKNILEHVGITKDINNKKNVTKLYLLYNARIDMNSNILQKLNKISSIISKK